jgi:transcriptional regulator with XRE-family HTH domain
MENLAYEIGKKIKIFRNKKKMTVQELADAICKSKSDHIKI